MSVIVEEEVTDLPASLVDETTWLHNLTARLTAGNF
jgi:hypothetical protein